MVGVTDDRPDYEGFDTARAGARFTDWLRAGSEPTWTAATDHRFVRELGSGNIDDAVFRRFLVQDFAFIESLVGVFGHAVGDAPTMEAKSRLVDFLAVLTDEENEYFEQAFEALGVSRGESADPERTPTTRAFEDLLAHAAGSGGYAETLAVLVPAEWIYLEWATAAPESPPSRWYLAEWIDLHAADAFADFVGWLRRELDREGADASPRRRRKVDRLFRRTVELEEAFFGAAYNPGGMVSGGGQRW